MKKYNTSMLIEFVIIFLIGFLSAYLLNYSLLEFNIEKPFSLSILSGGELKAPSDTVNSENIEVYEDRVVLKIKNAQLSRYAPTGSMMPALSEESNGIRITPKDESEINVGDLVTFKVAGELIIHRVIEKGLDEEGVYFITKGDNNPVSDGKIRFIDIVGKTIALIY